ncbi:hypothetical protein L6164_012191 [Bauhinia variegata]|uniref:Uncharacterized protein n=1 Tax=Bauhinia variegata TaxID=167791 RepID=A0ACB9P9H7_BAUVA|nr:hypothetical protein L6164_012191 [Bauhinia variegata]
MQLNLLVQQCKHERECNAIIAQTREDKILRLESLMDGVLHTEEFMEEELVSLTHEHKILKEKYEYYPEVLKTKIELKRLQDELEVYQNFYKLGEREVLLEEIMSLIHERGLSISLMMLKKQEWTREALRFMSKLRIEAIIFINS